MKEYTVDVKLRFHVQSNDINKSIGDIVDYIVEELSDEPALEVQALSYEEGAWFLFKVNDETDKYVKQWLTNKIG